MEKNGRFFEGKTSARPMIYAYEDASYPGCLKVGYTAVDVEKRVAQQYPTLRPEGKKPYRVIFAEPALYEDGSSFTDHAVHRMLEKKGVEGVGGEWFRCTEKEIRAAWLAVRTRTANMENRTRDFTMRPEQAEFDLPGYERYWNSADKAGYSGTAVFTRRQPLSVTYDFGIDEHRHEGRVITAEYPDFYLVCCYTPNSKDQLARLDYRMAWEDDIRDYLLDLDAKKPVVYCGDLNLSLIHI